ncbi:MAG: S26 family signal peptidase [Clostridia bacterium]|nr:S26 family signal peptidase [Clostridia bacterium]
MVKNLKNNKILKRILFGIECALIVICVVFSVIVITNAGGFNKDETGRRSLLMTVESDSMTPTFTKSDLIITSKPIESGHYDLGTIVTFVDSGADGFNYYNTHRIVGYRYFDQNGQYSSDNVVYLQKGTLETFAQFENIYGENAFHSYITRGDKYTLESAGKNDISLITDFSIGKELDDAEIHQNSSFVAVYKTDIDGMGSVLRWFRDPTNFFLVTVLPLMLLFAYNIFTIVRIIVKNKIEKARNESKIDEDEIKRKTIEEYFISTGLSAEEAREKALLQFPIKTEETNIQESVLIETENN